MEAGGAISGANFGVFYTVMMQIGYNYFGKRALKQIDDGMSIPDILAIIQKELQPFNEQIMRIALDKMPFVIDLTAELAEKMIQAGLAGAGSNIIGGLDTLAHMVGGHIGHEVDSSGSSNDEKKKKGNEPGGDKKDKDKVEPKSQEPKYVNVKVAKLSPPFAIQSILKGDMTPNVLQWYIDQYQAVYNGGTIKWDGKIMSPQPGSGSKANLLNSIKLLKNKFVSVFGYGSQ